MYKTCEAYAFRNLHNTSLTLDQFGSRRKPTRRTITIPHKNTALMADYPVVAPSKCHVSLEISFKYRRGSLPPPKKNPSQNNGKTDSF